MQAGGTPRTRSKHGSARTRLAPPRHGGGDMDQHKCEQQQQHHQHRVRHGEHTHPRGPFSWSGTTDLPTSSSTAETAPGSLWAQSRMHSRRSCTSFGPLHKARVRRMHVKGGWSWGTGSADVGGDQGMGGPGPHGHGPWQRRRPHQAQRRQECGPTHPHAHTQHAQPHTATPYTTTRTTPGEALCTRVPTHTCVADPTPLPGTTNAQGGQGGACNAGNTYHRPRNLTHGATGLGRPSG